MAPSDSDSDSGWNKELIAAVSKKQGKTKTISEEDRIKQIQECLDEDADINTVDENGNTALHTAVKRNYQRVAEFLRKAGARTDIPNRNRETAISLARNLGKQEIACILNEPSTSRNSDSSSHNPSPNFALNRPDRKRTADAQDSSIDRSLSKIRQIDAPQADAQRDVVSYEQRSDWKRPPDDELVEHTKRLRKITLSAERETYGASGLKRSLHGTVYQLKHLMLIMHRARELNYSFRLATEMDTAEKFDDVVLRYKDSNGDEMYRFLQAKHKQDEDKAISAKDLSDIKNGDFSLLKYFDSWRKIERNPIFGGSRSKDFILCTNIGLKVDDLGNRNITVVEETEIDNLLGLRNVTNVKKQPRRYKLLVENSSSLWKTLKSRSTGKVTDDEISRFLDAFILAVNQPNEIELGEIIERDIGAEFNRLDAGIVRDSFQIEILDWFKTRYGTFLTDVDADEFFDKMKGKLNAIKTMAVGLDHVEKLQELGIRFNGVNTVIRNFINSPNDGSKQLLEIISPKQTLLTALRVCQTLTQRQKLYKNEIFTFVRLQTLSRQKISQLVLRAFEWSADQNLLIVDCESISAKQHLETLWNPICDIMARNVDKRMILITQAGKDLGSGCNLDRDICRVDNTDHSFKNLTNESQKKLLGKQVTKFQGANNSTNFAELLVISDWDNLGEDELKDLSNIMDTDSLVKLISEDHLQIGCELDGLEDVGDYYVSRTIFRHVVIKEDILEGTEIPDLLAISGIDQILSSESMRIEGTSRMNDTLGVSSIESYIPDELSRIAASSPAGQSPTNFITLARNREEKQFNSLCAENKYRNVHWLKREQGKYIWKKSQGHITYLVQHRDDNESIDISDSTGAIHLNEDQLTGHNEPVIISDTAGMGKSTMLTHLASEMKENEPDMLVLKINLNHHSTALAKVKEKPSYDLGSIDGAIQFLVQELLSGETNFSRKVFKRIIQRNHKVALIFDGFDEISPTYEKTVIDILQTLADHGLRKLLVATRPHTRGSLEAKLNAFSYEIRPFSTYDQERFLTSFWKTKFGDSHHDLNATAEDRIRKYTAAIMKTLADSIKDQRNKFTGIPLQAKLVAEIFEHHNEGVRENFDSCKDFIDSEVDEPKFPDKINLIYLYEHFVSKKFEIFFKKRGGNLADVAVLEDKEQRYKTYIAKHEKLALDTLFDKDKIEELLRSQPDSSYQAQESTKFKIPIERDGIITQFIDGQPRFGHRTYAEYFAAKFFSKILKKREPDDSFGKIFVAHVLLEDKYETMRAFMNWLLSDEYGDVLEDEFWTRFVKEHRSEKKETIFHLAAAEGNDRIIRIFLNCFGADHEDRKIIIHVRDFAGRTAVHRAVEYGQLDKIKLLTEDTDFEINCRDATGFTSLHRAAHMGALDIVKYFIDKGADVKIQDSSGVSPVYAAASGGKLDVLKYLLDKKADINSQTNNGAMPLHVAAKEGKSNIVKCLLDEGADINSRMHSGSTSLHLAIQEGKFDLSKYLIDMGADINSQGEYGFTPLHVATNKCNLDVVNYLLNKGADVNCRKNDGTTPLHVAAYEGKPEIVKCLLDRGIDVNSVTDKGWTPLHVAAQRGELDVVKYLLDKRANINSPTDEGATPLHAAAQAGELDLVKYLLDRGATIDSQLNDGSTPLHVAARQGKLDIVEYLLDQGADINSRTNNKATPLHVAASVDELEVVKYLHDKKVDINSEYNDAWTALHVAAYNGKLKVLKYLLDHGADINLQTSNGSTPLHVAAIGGELDALKYLLDKGADVNSQTNNGATPLHMAAHGGKLDLVKYLLDVGADINSQTSDGLTPLHGAAQKGQSDVVKYLLDKDADINLLAEDDLTPLYTAAKFGKLDVVEYFLEKGANINAQTKEGLTPLYAATKGGKLELVDYLIKNGADINLQMKNGWAPLYAAIEGGKFEVIEYLIEKGADGNLKMASGSTPLYMAVTKGQLDLIKYFIDKGANVNSQTDNGWTPLHAAVAMGELDLVKYLLDKGADVYSQTNGGWTPLHGAARKGELGIVDYLLEKGADIDLPMTDGKTPLYTAANGGQLEMVKYLVEGGANINSRTNNGQTPLHGAVHKAEVDVVRYLLDNGAEVNSQTDNGWTPLHTAAFDGKLDLVECLLDKEADFYSLSNEGWMPIHGAVHEGQLDVVKCLLNKGFDINSQTNGGMTILHVAASKGKLGIVEYLLDNGANINLQTKKGSTPLCLATKQGELDVVKYLLDKGAEPNAQVGNASTLPETVSQEGQASVTLNSSDKAANCISQSSDDGWTLLHAAAFAGEVKMVKYLLDNGADVNSKSNDGWTPLHAAAQQGKLDTVRHLLEKTADVNSKTNEGWTPLDVATARGEEDIVKYLLGMGAVNSQANEG